MDADACPQWSCVGRRAGVARRGWSCLPSWRQRAARAFPPSAIGSAGQTAGRIAAGGKCRPRPFPARLLRGGLGRKLKCQRSFRLEPCFHLAVRPAPTFENRGCCRTGAARRRHRVATRPQLPKTPATRPVFDGLYSQDSSSATRSFAKSSPLEKRPFHIVGRDTAPRCGYPNCSHLNWNSSDCQSCPVAFVSVNENEGHQD